MKQRRAHAILVQGTIHFLSFITPIKKQINKQKNPTVTMFLYELEGKPMTDRNTIFHF